MTDQPETHLPLTVGAGLARVDLAVSLSDVVIPGDDERREGITLGHLVAAQIASRVMPDLAELREIAEQVMHSQVAAAAAKVIAEALAATDWRHASRGDMTLAALIDAEVHRQLTTPDPATTARGRSPVPVIDAIVATAVTTALRDLTGAQVQQIIGKILADIAHSGGRG